MRRLFVILLLAQPLLHGRILSGADWPQLLGPNRNGEYRGSPILTAWDETPPSILWRTEIGAGFAGPVAQGSEVFILHRMGAQDILEALRRDDGSRIWRSSYPSSYRDDYGFNNGPRATPVVSGTRVLTFSAAGLLQAWNRSTGERLWRVDTHGTFGVDKGFFGAASSPLVAGDLVLVNVGGRDEAGVVAFDLASGETVWRSSDHGASYSSPVLTNLGGRPSAIFFTREGLLALEPESGRKLLEFPWRARLNASVNAATPLVVEDRVFLSSSYGTGAVLLRVAGGELQELWRSKDSLTNHYATSVHHEGHLYGFHGRQEGRPSLRCVRLDTGEVVWSEDRFGAGTLLLTGDHLLILTESGDLLAAPATPRGFSPTGRARILDGETRAYPALADGILLARDDRRLVAVDLRPPAGISSEARHPGRRAGR